MDEIHRVLNPVLVLPPAARKHHFVRIFPRVVCALFAVLGAVPSLVRETGRGAGDFEYQMLYGIRDDEQLRLASSGWPLRL